MSDDMTCIATYLPAGRASNEFMAWLADHGIDGNHTYRAEIWHKRGGGDILRAFTFAVDEHGHHYVGEDGEIAKQQSADIPITRRAPRYS